MTTLLDLAKRHCRATKPAVCLKPFCREAYGASYDTLRDIQCGRVRASMTLIARVTATHARLFPGEPVPEFPAPPRNPQLN